MHENIPSGEIPFRKADSQSVVDRIAVDDHAIRIIGDKATLEQVVAGAAKIGPWGSQFCTQMARPKRFELLTPQIRSLMLVRNRLSTRAAGQSVLAIRQY
ncbi:hypothetical protein [Pseudorhodoplanes sinuspersici]|uniref:Uncharacterized protein n=1 Tax=Pseudorhodoplanes sinuspersici TaxID=1235591 RepID=A0A1W6ZRZ4_9HYPH|nr:hypothetical protein [Pseudorhodoplanes sinuspersici]ARQ00093.1 hypothetical protein CAK95_14125 [Pseudorhodoplanes sinuspersici]